MGIDLIRGISISYSNLSRIPSPDIAFCKKLIGDNFYQLSNYKDTSFGDMPQNLTLNKKFVDLLSYYKTFQPLFFNFSNLEMTEALLQIKQEILDLTTTNDISNVVSIYLSFNFINIGFECHAYNL